MTPLAGCGSGSSAAEPSIAATECCSKIVLFDSRGDRRTLTEGENPQWSPDHRTLVFTRANYEVEPGPTNDIWIINANGGGLRQLTFTPAPNQVRFVAYGGDPPRIAYDDSVGIWTMNPDGSDRREVISDGGNADSLAISPDGAKIAFASSGTARSRPSLRVVAVDGKGSELAFRGTAHTCSTASPSWSPDGGWIVFCLCVSKGGLEVENGIWMVRPDGAQLHRVVASGSSPTWSPDGEWIAFVKSNAEGQTTVAEIHPDGSGLRLLLPYRGASGAETYETPNW